MNHHLIQHIHTIFFGQSSLAFLSQAPPPPPLPPTRSSPHAFTLNLIVTFTFLFHPTITPKKDQSKGPNIRLFVIAYLIILNDRDYENRSREHIMLKECSGVLL